MTPEERKKRARLLALAKAKSSPKYPAMSQVNKGIAQSVGGLVDFVNPFDKYTGSAEAGLETLMNSAGIETASGEPKTTGQAIARGVGQAAGSFIPIAGGINAMSRVGGITGAVAGDVYSAMVPTSTVTAPSIAGRAGQAGAALTRATVPFAGAAGDMVAGGLASGADRMAEEMGAGPTGRAVAAMAAPLAMAAPGMAVRGAVRFSPTGAIVRRAAKEMAPFTNAGARQVANERLTRLAGGQDRAGELGARIGGENPLNLTPAQQTQDPNLLAVERLAAQQDPVLGAEIEARRQGASDIAESEIRGMGGDVEAAQAFFTARRKDFTDDLQARADKAVSDANDRIAGITGKRPDGANSQDVFDSVKLSFDTARLEEKALWDAIPRDVDVGTSNAKAAAERWANDLGRAGADDMPRLARQLLIDEGGYSGNETVGEMHRLYSKMREVSRNAMAGTNKQATLAKVANEIADAILKDLGAGEYPTSVGRQINEARAYSAAMHEVFDQGAAGKILKRTLDGDTTIEPQMSLQRTVGQAGTAGAVASNQLEIAGAKPDNITDYIASQFNARANPASTGAVSLANARKFMADNSELMARYPELKAEIDNAIAQGESAEGLAQRITRRVAALTDAKRSATARFIGGSSDKAISAVINARNPISAARRIVNEARKDKTGQALDGVKAVFTDYLIGSATTTKGATTSLDATRLNAVLADTKTRRAMEQIFTASEMSRLRFMAKELAKAQASTSASIGTSLSGASANRVIEFLARVAAAKHGAALGGGSGGSLQTAQMASSRVKEMIGSLATDKAAQMISDAITDPELFKSLLTQMSVKNVDRRVVPYFMPYLIGGASAAMQQ